MVTYQDFLSAKDMTSFIKNTIDKHKSSSLYQTALLADEYDRRENRTIKLFQKVLRNLKGKVIPDIWGSNFKMPSNFFTRFIVQENQYLLGNGVTWKEKSTKTTLGMKFDTQLQKLGRKALSGGVSFGFWNSDHLEVFSVLEFAPLYDEEDGALKAGIRWWQIDPNKPLRATLYELDGYTDYIWDDKHTNGDILHDKTPYKLHYIETPADGRVFTEGENYPTFPIVPLWGNSKHQSEIVGLREQIDCYDLIKSGYANNVDEGSIIYWTLQNAGGMGDIDLEQFVTKMKTLHAATMDDGVKAESHNLEAPYQSREALLTRLRADLYETAMALDTKNIADGAVTATQIKAAYEPLNSKTDEYEYCILDFLASIMELAGVKDTPTFTRSVIVNSQEEVQVVISAAQFLPEDYITKKILTLLGDGDEADTILKQMDAEELDRGNNLNEDSDEDE